MFSNSRIEHQTVVEYQYRQFLQVIDHPPACEGVVYMRTIYVGRKPVHSYVAAVLRAMQDGDREVEIIARGNAMRTAIDAAEICRRRNGKIAGLLPEEMVNNGVEISTEEIEVEGSIRVLSSIKILLEGIGEMPEDSEE
ncbi:MAG: hypothetical protein CMA77_00515 [Euryarchaeota archaeon]|nr:hypothetical protein [Euryarchaeota archaeon]|tara:strand:+ start:268 stop:684 length:417 start_codon:yes stop_codon:yes gene_type:complete